MKKVGFYLIFISLFQTSFTQKLEILVNNSKESFRGLSVVNDSVLWVSGTHGTVGKSTDGGNTFQWMTVKNFEQSDFRDIEAIDKNTAIIMAISEPAFILKTTDGGNSWKVTYENHTKGMFLDAMDFRNESEGIVIGDPIDGKMFIAKTLDGGNSWEDISQQFHETKEGEACFASSGTNIKLLKNKKPVFVTGGLYSRFFDKNKFQNLPLLKGKESTGANSIAIKNNRMMIIVGGDFMTKNDTVQNCVLTKDGGKTFLPPEIPPHGYRSCVEYLKGKNWISCGLNGIDMSLDDGKTWQLISNEGFHVCRKSSKGKIVYFAGNGKIGKLNLN